MSKLILSLVQLLVLAVLARSQAVNPLTSTVTTSTTTVATKTPHLGDFKNELNSIYGKCVTSESLRLMITKKNVQEKEKKQGALPYEWSFKSTNWKLYRNDINGLYYRVDSSVLNDNIITNLNETLPLLDFYFRFYNETTEQKLELHLVHGSVDKSFKILVFPFAVSDKENTGLRNLLTNSKMEESKEKVGDAWVTVNDINLNDLLQPKPELKEYKEYTKDKCENVVWTEFEPKPEISKTQLNDLLSFLKKKSQDKRDTQIPNTGRTNANANGANTFQVNYILILSSFLALFL